MTPMNRRHMTLSLLAGSLGTGLFAGCATKADDGTILLFQRPPPPTAEELAEIKRQASLSITHPERAKEFDDVWQHVNKHTEAVAISDNRIRIRSKGTLLAGDDISEQNFFVRAAAETLRREKDGFVIKQVDFYSEGTPWANLGSNINMSTRNWIGNYEDFRSARNEQNIFSSRRSIRNKAMDGVIFLLNKDEFPNRDRFTASEIYINLLNHKSK